MENKNQKEPAITVKEETTKWSKDILIMSIFMEIMFSFSLSEIAANVLFVKRIGAEFLPYAYIADAILGGIVIFFIASNIKSVKITHLIQIISISGILILSLLSFFTFNQFTFSYAVLPVFVQILFPALSSILIWSLALKLCSPFEAKRSFGLYSLGGSIGGILAGVTSSLLSEISSTEALLPIVIFSLFIALIISFFIGYKYKFSLQISEEEIIESQQNSYRENYKKGEEEYKKNKLAKLIALALMLFYISSWIVDYEYQKILGENLSEENFTLINGLISIIENFTLILIFLFVQHRLLRKIGVVKTLATSPGILLIPFLGILFYPIVLAASVLKITERTINTSTFSNSVRLLFTAIPNKVRSSVTTFIKSKSQSYATLIAGIGLLVLTRVISNTWIILTGIILLICVIVLVHFINKEYIKQLTKNLESEDINDLYNAIEDFAEPAYQSIGVNELMKLINKGDLQPETIRKIIFALGKIDNVNVIPSLLDLFKTYDTTVKYAIIEAIHGFSKLNDRLKDLPFTKQAIIDTYKNIFLKEEDPDIKIFILRRMRDFDPENVIQFLKEAIKNQNTEVQNQAINAMKFFHDRGTIKFIKPFLNNENIMTQANALIALWEFKEMRPELLKKFITHISQDSKESTLATLYTISQLNFYWEYKFAEEKLNSDDEEIKTMAALTLMELGRRKGLKLIVNNLIAKTNFSRIIARNLKTFPRKIKHRILKLVKEKSEIEIEICIQNLKETYLDFSSEIQYLLGDSTNLRSI